MKAYSIDLRTKIVESVRRRGVSTSETARRFRINRSTVARYLKQLDEEGSLIPKKPRAPLRSYITAPCGCLRNSSRLVRGLPTNREASFSLPLAALRLARQRSVGRSRSAFLTAEKKIYRSQ